MDSNNDDKNNSIHVPGQHQPGMGRDPQDYARQQEDLRATQTFGESSLDRGSDRQHHTERAPEGTGDQEFHTGKTHEDLRRSEEGVIKPENSKKTEDPIKPKHDRGYDIAPTATNVKL